MSRLFLAVRPSPQVLGGLASLERAPQPGVRWVPDHQLHVTLRFLGRAEPTEVMAALAGVELPACTAELAGPVGRLGRSVVVVPVAGLEGLASVVRSSTAGVGEPPDPRGFRGHLTLARLKNRAACGLVGARPAGRWRVREVELVSSVTDPAGVVHETVARFAVGAGPGNA